MSVLLFVGDCELEIRFVGSGNLTLFIWVGAVDVVLWVGTVDWLAVDLRVAPIAEVLLVLMLMLWVHIAIWHWWVVSIVWGTIIGVHHVWMRHWVGWHWHSMGRHSMGGHSMSRHAWCLHLWSVVWVGMAKVVWVGVAYVGEVLSLVWEMGCRDTMSDCLL